MSCYNRFSIYGPVREYEDHFAHEEFLTGGTAFSHAMTMPNVGQQMVLFLLDGGFKLDWVRPVMVDPDNWPLGAARVFSEQFGAAAWSTGRESKLVAHFTSADVEVKVEFAPGASASEGLQRLIDLCSKRSKEHFDEDTPSAGLRVIERLFSEGFVRTSSSGWSSSYELPITEGILDVSVRPA